MLDLRPTEVPDNLMQVARKRPCAGAIVAGADTQSVMESTRDACDAGLIEPILIGDLKKMQRHANEAGFDISQFRQVSALGDLEIASQLTEQAGSNPGALILKGHIHTDTFMKALLKRNARFLKGNKISHVFHMTVPDNNKPLLITDGAVNIEPNEITLQAVMENGVALAQKIGIDRPKLALLSATETPIKSMPSSMMAEKLSEWGKSALPQADIYGPLAFDLAVSGKAAEIKGVQNKVTGQADILVVPNIECGNALFKMMVYFMAACAAGVVLGGNVPATITSRADPPQARLASIALARIAAEN